MSAVADVDGDAAELGGEHSVSSVALHVVGRFVEVPHPRNVVLPRNTCPQKNPHFVEVEVSSARS